MTNKELIKAKEILRENHINANPIKFWERKYYYTGISSPKVFL